MGYCNKCGAEVDENNKFCQQCGAPTSVANEKITKTTVGKLFIGIIAILIVVIIIMGIIIFTNNNKEDSKSNDIETTETSHEDSTTENLTESSSTTYDDSTEEVVEYTTEETTDVTTESMVDNVGEINDYATIIYSLNDKGELPTNEGIIELNLPSRSESFGDIDYVISDINQDGYEELLIYDEISEYPVTYKLYLYGYDLETNKIEFKFSNDAFMPVVYDNGYIMCGFSLGMIQYYTCYKYNSDTDEYDVVYDKELFSCQKDLTSEEYWGQDLNNNEYVFCTNNDDGTKTITDDDYPEWFQENLGNASILNLQYDDISAYQP